MHKLGILVNDLQIGHRSKDPAIFHIGPHIKLYVGIPPRNEAYKQIIPQILPVVGIKEDFFHSFSFRGSTFLIRLNTKSFSYRFMEKHQERTAKTAV